MIAAANRIAGRELCYRWLLCLSRPSKGFEVRKLVCALFILAVVTPVGSAAASNTQWSIFEDAAHLVTTSPQTRAATLGEIRRLGADTIRVQLSWSSVAPRPRSKKRPRFNAKDPAAYPGFASYDDLVRQATADGFRLLVTITGDAPALGDGAAGGAATTSSARPNSRTFARAVGRRYSGRLGGLPAVYLLVDLERAQPRASSSARARRRRGSTAASSSAAFRRCARRAPAPRSSSASCARSAPRRR